MSGGANEFVASFDAEKKTDYLSKENYGLYMVQEAKDSSGNYTSTKYITVYNNGTTSFSGNSIIYSVGKIGDSTKEVNTGGKYTESSTNVHNNWFTDFSNLIYSSRPFYVRGGSYSNSLSAGIYNVGNSTGEGTAAYTLRTVLCP